MQFKHIVGLIAFSAILQSCWKKPGVWKNEKIDPTMRAERHAENDSLFLYLKNNDVDRMKYLETKETIDNMNDNLRSFERIVDQAKNGDYRLLDEYYVVNRYKTDDTIANNLKSVNGYNLFYKGQTHEMYFAFFVPKNGIDKYMISAAYVKTDKGWKITALETQLYTINGKTAPELYNTAKAEAAQGYTLSAANMMDLAHLCQKPNAWWTYSHESAMDTAYVKFKLAAREKYTSKLLLNNIPTHPSIFRLFESEFKSGFYPTIYYQTVINVNDTAAIRKENNAMMKELPKQFPGIDQHTDWLLFIAYNKLPNQYETVPRYEMHNRVGK